MKTQTAIPVFYTGTSTVNNEVEIWRDVRDFEGYYKVSNLGRIKSLNYRKSGKEGIITPMHRNCDQYLRISLSKKGKKEYRYLHRIVAEAFIPNPYNFPEVNHIDTNPRNCNVNNLHWCTHEQNTNHWKTRLNRSKKVYCYNSSGDLEYKYSSVTSCAAALGSNPSYISQCTKNGKKYKGYTLSYTKL